MRKFKISVDPNLNVLCEPEKMHVSPHIFEEFAVCLDKEDIDYYDLDVEFDENPKDMLKKEKLTPSVWIIGDDNREPCEAKFSVILKPWEKNGADTLTLDPRVVNE
jgi:hypothetical protein